MIEKEKNPMEYFTGIKKICPYCRKKIHSFDHKTWANGGFSSYSYCIKCERIFEVTFSLIKNSIGIKTRQLTKNQEMEVKKEYNGRLKKLKHGK